jgi:hypothetical protein
MMSSPPSFYRRAMLAQGHIPINVIPCKPPRWDAQRRLKVALANNNKGLWYVCLARKTVADLERRFAEGSVAVVLYHVVGGLLGDHKTLRAEAGQHYMYIQLTRLDADVGLCLGELTVKPLDRIAFSKIRYH